MADPDRMALFDLAAMLHKTVSEVEQMTVTEFNEWCAWSRVRNDDKSNS